MIINDSSGNLMADTLMALCQKIRAMEEDVDTKDYYYKECEELRVEVKKLKGEIDELHRNNITLTSRRVAADQQLDAAEELINIFLQ